MQMTPASRRGIGRRASLAVAPAVVALAAALLAVGCGDDGPTGSDDDDLLDTSTPRSALFAMADYWGQRRLEEAQSLLSPDYRFYPIDPTEISYLEDGETYWDYDREVEILEEVLVPERSTWLDQVLVEIDVDDVTDLGNGRVEVEATAELQFTLTGQGLERSRVRMLYELEQLESGNYRVVSERETARVGTDQTVGVLKASALEDRDP
jgi:hypothetical protein